MDKKDDSLLRIMVAPAGDSLITPSLGSDACAELTIRIDESTAKVLDASLDKLNAENAPQRALIDFEHENRQAMAWPISFEWYSTPKPGVYAIAELSSLGRDYVKGKVVRSFSLSFFTDGDFPKKKDIKKGMTYEPKNGQRGSPENPARITGLAFPYCGTLTNDPAFRRNLPLFAVRGASLADLNAKIAANRLLALESRHMILLLERRNQMLRQLIRPPSESELRIAAVDAAAKSRSGRS